jgi:hypothetical protein
MSEPRRPFINVDGLCKLLGVQSPDDFTSKALENSDVYALALRDGATEEEAMKAEEAEQDEAYNHYYDAVTDVAEKLFAKHDLELVPRGKSAKTKRPYEFRVAPTTSWLHSAARIMTTINGVGQFEFHSVKEFLDSGPYTPTQAVLQHLGWIAWWPDVYEGRKASTLVDWRLR